MAPGRRQENIIVSCKREQSRKPDEQYELIESCSPGPYLEHFAQGERDGWFGWGDQAGDCVPDWATYANHSQSKHWLPVPTPLFPDVVGTPNATRAKPELIDH